jgi:hypothetical protein
VHLAKLDETEITLTEPEWREVISPDGVRCFVTKSTPTMNVITKTGGVAVAISADLSIPEFLQRQS